MDRSHPTIERNIECLSKGAEMRALFFRERSLWRQGCLREQLRGIQKEIGDRSARSPTFSGGLP